MSDAVSTHMARLLNGLAALLLLAGMRTADASAADRGGREVSSLAAEGELLAAGIVPGDETGTSFNFRPHGRRALLVGINAYAPDRVEGEVERSSDGRRWRNLAGSVNDALTMRELLVGRYGFAPEDVLVLTDSAATRDGILQAIQSHLIDPARTGDEVLFYYAGHGSQVENTGSNEGDRMDETIVPADAYRGARDIRDKELSAHWNVLLDRVGATGQVTLIFDSCHSGSVDRGLPTGGATRSIEPPSYTVHETAETPFPSERGAVVLSAAQEHELAREVVDDDRTTHGGFTWALSRVLRTRQPDTPLRRVFEQTRALMKAMNLTQEPVLAGLPANLDRPLSGFGEGESARGGVVADVIRVDAHSGEVLLQGGLALGLREGTELRSLRADSIRIRVAAGPEVASSRARALDPADLGGIAPGDAFRVDRWRSSPGIGMRIWIPPAAASHDAVASMVDEVDALCRHVGSIRCITRPSETAPTHTLAWDGSQWRLQRADGTVAAVYASLSARDVESSLADVDVPAIFVSLPPFQGLADSLETAAAEAAARYSLVERREDAHYLLSGTSEHGTIAYRWLLSSAGGGTDPAITQVSDPVVVAPNRVGPAVSVLSDYAGRIARSWSWLHLESPPDDGSFPYYLAGLLNHETGEIAGSGSSVHASAERSAPYQLVLRADSARITDSFYRLGQTSRYVYLFAMDQKGKSTLIFPRTVGNAGNTITINPDADTLRVLGPRFGIGRPLGIDTFFMLTTAEPLPDPTVLEFDGPTRGGGLASGDPLSALLSSVGSRSTFSLTTPATWSVERVTLRSVPARSAGD